MLFGLASARPLVPSLTLQPLAATFEQTRSLGSLHRTDVIQGDAAVLMISAELGSVCSLLCADVSNGQLVASGTLLLEPKFFRGCTMVRFLLCTMHLWMLNNAECISCRLGT